METITSGSITAFYLFDVSETIDLSRLREQIGGGAAAARLVPKAGTPSYFTYAVPPVVVEGEALGITDIDGFRTRVKFFDYGVVSLALTKPFAGSWEALIALSQNYIENDRIEQQAERACRQVVERCQAAIPHAREQWLSEDYLVFSVTGLEPRLTASTLVEQRAAEIALLLRGERQPLSEQEQEEVLRSRVSYLVDDLVVPTWNAALVYDSEAGVQPALEIFEFANSQLLEYRYYDALLDVELARIYGRLQQKPRFESLAGRAYVRATRELHALFIDVNDVTDRTQNALKLIGDIYAARLFHLVATRLGVPMWKASVDEKLKTLDDIYRFAVEQVAISRGHLLELAIVGILVFELLLFFLGIMP